MADFDEQKEKSDKGKHGRGNVLDELNPFNWQFLLLIGIIVLLLALGSYQDITTVLLITLFTPVYAAVIWIFIVFLRFIINRVSKKEGILH